MNGYMSIFVDILVVLTSVLSISGVISAFSQTYRKVKAERELSKKTTNYQHALENYLEKYHDAEREEEKEEIIWEARKAILEILEQMEVQNRKEILEALRQPSEKGRENYIVNTLERSRKPEPVP